MAVKNNFAFQLIPVLFDMVVLYHNHHHIHLIEEGTGQSSESGS